MNVAVVKGLLAMTAACCLLGGLAVLCRQRRTLGSLFLVVGASSFVIVALAHVFEALGILRAAGWGQPRSVGHYIDLGAALLGFILMLAGLVLQYVHQSSRRGDPPR
jgi:hypothetical protein